MKNNKLRFQGVIIGILISSILLTSITVFASGLTKSIKVILNSVVVKIDGITLSGDNINYNNNIYIRADKVSEFFDKNIFWDKKNNTINIGKIMSTTPTPSPISIGKGIFTTVYVDKSYGIKPTIQQLESVKAIIDKRLEYKGIYNKKVNIDESTREINIEIHTNNVSILKNPKALIAEIIRTVTLTFQEVDVSKKDKDGNYLQTNKIVVSNKDIISTWVDPNTNNVMLNFNTEGTKKISEATTRLAPERGIMAMFLDDKLIMSPSVEAPITGGTIMINGNFSSAIEAGNLVDLIRCSTLPFKLLFKDIVTK